MVKVSVEVRSGTARFTVGVRAESVERAVSLVEGQYSGKVRVKVPTGGLFKDLAPAVTARPGQPHMVAA